MPAALAELPAGIPSWPSQRIGRFFERHLIHGKGQFAGRPFRLEGWEMPDLVEPVYDPLVLQGDYLIRQVTEAMLGIAKKNGKTHLAAGLGAYGLFADGYWRREGGAWLWTPEIGAEVYNVAGSKDQAKVLFSLAKAMVERSPMLSALTQGKIWNDVIEFPEQEAIWRVMAADAKLAHGPNPSTTIIDEIWVHRSPDLYEAFSAGGAARIQPLVIIITTAGFDRESIAYKLYVAGRKKRSRTFYFKWFQAPPGRPLDDMRATRAANPSKWVTAAYLRKELVRARRTGLESEFRRWHRNEWTSGTETAIPVELWESCRARPRIPLEAPVVIGVDSAPKRDTTGIVVAHKDAGGVHHWRSTIMRADPETGYLDFDAMEDVLRQLCRTYTVGRILVDAYNMTRSMLLLQEEGLPVEEFPQNDLRMVPACLTLYELLVERRLRHGGDPYLRDQVQAAAKRITERGWRFSKRTSSGPIDALIAGTMASYELERQEEEMEPQLF